MVLCANNGYKAIPLRRGKDAEEYAYPAPLLQRKIMRTVRMKVECYLGREREERPVWFWAGGRQYQVEIVADPWHEEEQVFYRVQADDGI